MAATRNTPSRKCLRAMVCFTGMLSDVWSIPDFNPMAVRAATCSLRRYVDLVEAGRLPLKIHQVSAFDEIAEAHRVMEAGEPVVRVS